MRLITLAIVSTVTASAVASPYRHAHVHSLRAVARRGPQPAVVYKPGPVATVIVYVLNGQRISEDEVRQGVANGTLVWGDDGNLSTSSSALATPTPLPTSERPKDPDPPHSTQSSLDAPKPPLSSSVPPEVQPLSYPDPVKVEADHPQATETPVHQDTGNHGIDAEFPNGEFPCDQFPVGFGATPIEHASLNGWIGIQAPGFDGAEGFGDILTVVGGSCKGDACCKPGAYCSYSCPPGYLKSSWPRRQGVSGQSIGGLFCNVDGKLEMATGSIAKTLCVKGTEKISVKVQNKLSVSDSICRTDYPGTESMTIPVTTQPGDLVDLACPDNKMYYRWKGSPTSAQYYINPKGVPENEACQWGDGSRPIGNWAPVNLGVGFDSVSQKGYISLFPNAPTNPDGKLDFNVELVADDMEGRCKYSNGQYYFGNDYSDSSRTKGCTVAVNSGTLTVVLSDD